MRPVFLACLSAFLGLHLALTLFIYESFSPDDADLMVFSQSLAWGYHEQPPLYAWLAWVMCRIFGLNYFALGALRFLILAAIYAAMFWSARQLLHDERRALLAAFSPLLIPLFSWHSLSYLTHTNLLCACCVVTFCALVRLHRCGQWRDYVLVGLMLGLGTLSKYNYVLFAGILLLAGLTVPSVRSRLFHWRMLIALGVAAIIVLPHALWLMSHVEVIAGQLSAKAAWPPVGRPVGGAGSLVLNTALILAPFTSVFVLLFPQSLRASLPSQDAGDPHRLLGRFLLLAFVLLFAVLALTGADRCHERWLQPFTLLAPLYFFGRLRGVQLPEARLRWFGYGLAGCAVLLTGARVGQGLVGGADRGIYPMQMLFAAATGELAAAAGPGATFVASEREICGNLRCRLPEARHLCAMHPLYVPGGGGDEGPCVFVWNTLEGEQLPESLRAYAARVLHLELPADLAARYVEVRPRISSRRVNQLAYLVVTPPDSRSARNALREGSIQSAVLLLP